jgi:hypothetical protein
LQFFSSSWNHWFGKRCNFYFERKYESEFGFSFEESRIALVWDEVQFFFERNYESEFGFFWGEPMMALVWEEVQFFF